jgi:RNA polymerase sigma-70 factor, ECF subfamily
MVTHAVGTLLTSADRRTRGIAEKVRVRSRSTYSLTPLDSAGTGRILLAQSQTHEGAVLTLAAHCTLVRSGARFMEDIVQSMETSPLDPVSKYGSGHEAYRRLQAASASRASQAVPDSAPRDASPERHRVSDWASALSWGRDESELVTELQAGSEAAFDFLVTHYHAPVFNLILGMLADSSDAADGTQEVFLKAFKGIKNFRQGSSLKTWLYRIAIREALNHRRWFKRHLQKNVSIDAEPEEGHAKFEIEDMHATPFDQLASREIQSVVHSALGRIPDVFRSAVILRDLEGLSYEEVAEVLECSVGTVKSRILRGRRALKDLLDPLLGEQHAAYSAAPEPAAKGFSVATFAPAFTKERMNFAPHADSGGSDSVAAKEDMP